jgi:GAF domain-containing protein
MIAMTDADSLARTLRDALERASDRHDAMRHAVTTLHAAIPHYTWVGIYVLEGDELVLGPFVGKPSPHTRIPLGRGICGAAATSRSTIIVDDVNADPRYLACSIETRSEIVVPIMRDGDVLGEIDIDSDTPAAFGPADRELLEAVAESLAQKLGSAEKTTEDAENAESTEAP